MDHGMHDMAPRCSMHMLWYVISQLPYTSPKNSSLWQEHSTHRYLRRILTMAHPLAFPVLPLLSRHRRSGRALRVPPYALEGL